jgi:hypothetical protein
MRVGVWTTDDGVAWTLRALLTNKGSWLIYGPVVGPRGLLLLALHSHGFPASPGAEYQPPEVTGWLLPPGGSPGYRPDGGEPPVSSGCDAPRVGTGWSLDYLESEISIDVPVTFVSTTVDGQQAWKSTNGAGTVEALLIGDPADIGRIEVRGRDIDTEGGAAAFALGWLWPNNDPLEEAMLDLVDGVRDHFEMTVGDVVVTGDRLTEGQWQYQFVVVPAAN